MPPARPPACPPARLPLTSDPRYVYPLGINLRSRTVKPDLHPSYKKLTAVCACGNSFETRSTAASIHVEVCAQCHPYFTGRQRLVDTAGRVDRFRRKYQTEPAAAAKA
jgi:large subunit ribosomal protein L31